MATGQYVATAIVGAIMPNGMEIKPVKLRGVDSAGMICSSTEIGLPKLEEGIMVLDESIGSLELGSSLSENPLLNDDLIELELTANRGDCLSIRGVARDLCAAFNKELKQQKRDDKVDGQVGIGRILQLEIEENLDVNLRYKAVDLKNLHLPVRIALRLAQVEESKESAIESLLHYATYNSGVILRAYHFGFLVQEGAGKGKIVAKTDENGFAAIYGKKKASIIGIRQEEDSRVSYNEGTVVIEASYIPPDIISQKISETKIENGPLFYRTSRGSEPELEFGLDGCLNLFEHYSDSTIYGGCVESYDEYDDRVVTITIEEINAIIGTNIDKTTISKLFRNLGFNMEKSRSDAFVIGVPRYRHDIVNKQDIIEEIVRIVGIDNIPSKPFVFTEENRLDDDFFSYKKRQHYRHRGAQSGFYESVHFVFNERAVLEKQGFVCVDKEKELLNPITGTLDTLRPTLMLSLLESASKNAKAGQKMIPLFEVGSIFDTQRSESVKMGFIYSGTLESDRLSNGGKPERIDFSSFTQKVSDVIGDFTLRNAMFSHHLAHKYQSAEIMIDEVCVGEVFKLHPTLQKEYDLDDTFLCEVDFSALKYALQEADTFSKYQTSFRDLSLLMPASMEYASLENVIKKHKSSEVIRFYPVDRYSDESLGENVSLTLRFVLQSMKKTLEEEDITTSMSTVLTALETELGLTLR
ncbi:MAG: phenylalanine--tRNA ligase subunit beta [Epsilonproteobacteria bacterium]|nr:MAG: phenylalanine--tRNA ligase subunit beta [Campylobacterota bacterium]